MTDPVIDPNEGSGSVKTYLAGARAEVTVEADIYPRFDPPLRTGFDVPTITVEAAGFDVDDYVVLGGQPTGQAICHATAISRVGTGVYYFTDKPPAPQDVSVGSTLRWLPTPDTFVEDQAWYPLYGSGITLLPGTPEEPAVSPYYDPDYTFGVRGGDSVSTPAVIFSGDAWMQTDDVGWSAQAFTVVLTAVLHQNPEGPAFGLFESYTPPVDPAGIDPASGDVEQAQSTDWGLRYRQGTLEMWAGSTVVAHPVSIPQARAVVMAVAMDPVAGKLVVVDRNKSTRSFSTDGFNLFDVQLYLGRTGGSFDAGQTAYMDVLEFNYWDRALSFDELADVVHTMDALYGVVG